MVTGVVGYAYEGRRPDDIQVTTLLVLDKAKAEPKVWFSPGKEFIAIRVKNNEAVESFSQFFNTMWEQATK